MTQEDYFMYNFATQFANMVHSQLSQARQVVEILENKKGKEKKEEDPTTIAEMKEQIEILTPKLNYYQGVQEELHNKYFDIKWDYKTKK